jgi:hypothetical protein
MGVKDFLMKKLAERQLKDLPADQREIIMRLLENNPDLFMKMSKEERPNARHDGGRKEVSEGAQGSARTVGTGNPARDVRDYASVRRASDADTFENSVAFFSL